jgi:nucleoside phosphorylase
VRLLVVAATESELAAAPGAETLCCGIGPVEAALATARALEHRRPRAILHLGIAGARELAPGALVLGSAAVYVDAGAVAPMISAVAPDPALLAAARAALPDAHVTPIATSARIGGAAAFEVEAMEGFAVLRAAAEAGVPALELRAISNGYADARADWRVGDALAALADAVARLKDVFDA